jgi:hypothetical protein
MGPIGGGHSGPPKGGDSGPSRDQNPRSYIVGLVGLWIGPTWNLQYLSWYLIKSPITPNPPPSWKSLPYPIYTMGTYPNANVCIFCKAIQANGKNNDVDTVNFFCFTFCDAISNWRENLLSLKI